MKANLNYIKCKLKQSSTSLSGLLGQELKESINIDKLEQKNSNNNLTQKKPLTNRIISDDLIIVKNLPRKYKEEVMKPLN